MTQPVYRYSDHYNASFKTVRDLNNTLRNELLSKTGGVVTGPIYLNSAVETNEFATKQYVIDNAGSSGGGGGSGSHPDKIESQDALKSTSVLTTTDGVFIADDSTTSFHFSKKTGLPIATLKGELDQLRIATDELRVMDKAEIVTALAVTPTGIEVGSTMTYADGIGGSTAQSIPSRSQIETLIETARNNVNQLIDDNADASGNTYRLKISNDRLEFARNVDTTPDTWLRLFGSATTGTDGVVQQTNRSNFVFESDDLNSNTNNLVLRHSVNTDPTSLYQMSGIAQITQGKVNDLPVAAYGCYNPRVDDVGAQSNQIAVFPKNSLTSGVINKIQASTRMGYEIGSDLTSSSDNSLLSRLENDNRYYLATKPVDQLTKCTATLDVNNNRIANLSPGTISTDGVNLDQLTRARQGFSIVRKTTTALTSGAKVTGFVLQQESNAQRCYWDNANQTFLVSVGANEVSVDVEFVVRVSFNIVATGNSATLVLRDFTSNTNFADTFLFATKQNQTGYFSETVSIVKTFTTNRFVGLYVSAQNGNPPFGNLDIVMQAKSLTTSTQVNIPALQNSSQTKSVSVDAEGLKADQVAQIWNLNNGKIRGVVIPDFTSEPFSGDYAANLQYVNDQVVAGAQTALYEQLTTADFVRFGITASGFSFRDLTTTTDKFEIQTDVPAGQTKFSVDNGLTLFYKQTPTLTDDSILTKSQIEALISASGGRRSYIAYVFYGDHPMDASFSWDSSPASLITSIGVTPGVSVNSLDITHAPVPFRHRVFLTRYSTNFSTNNNDDFSLAWPIQVDGNNSGSTQTRICFEGFAESVQQQNGFNIMWMEY